MKKLKKIYQGQTTPSKILNEYSTSTTDTYNCEIINGKLNAVDYAPQGTSIGKEVEDYLILDAGLRDDSTSGSSFYKLPTANQMTATQPNELITKSHLDAELQYNVDKEVIISTSKPVISSNKLWVDRSINLLPNNASTATINGVTFTKNNDGTVTVNGTATSNADYYIYGSSTDNGTYLHLSKGSYVVTKPTDTKIVLITREKNSGALLGGASLEGALSAGDCYIYGLLIRVENGKTVSNVTFYPQIARGSVAVNYTPYKSYSLINVNNNGIYDKLTDTVSVGIDSNNSGLWVEHNEKNLIDLSNWITPYYYNDSDGEIKSTKTVGNYALQNYIKVIPNTTYTISGTATYIRVIEYTNSKSFIKTNSSGTGSSKTFTTSSTTGYVRISFNGTPSTIQLEEGSTATTLEPYVFPNIKANIHGYYETIAYPNVYSTNETVIGEFLGKPLYRKVFLINSLPDGGNETVWFNTPTGLPSSCCRKVYGILYVSGNQIPLPLINPRLGEIIEVYPIDWCANITIETNMNLTNYTAHVTLEYTKNAD